MRPRSKSQISGGTLTSMEGYLTVTSTAPDKAAEKNQRAAQCGTINVVDSTRVDLTTTAATTSTTAGGEGGSSGAAEGCESYQVNAAAVATTGSQPLEASDVFTKFAGLQAVPGQLLSGINTMVLGYGAKGATHDSISRTLWGSAALTHDLSASSAIPNAGLLGVVGTEVINQLKEHTAASNEHSYEVSLSLLATKGNTVRDLIAASKQHDQGDHDDDGSPVISVESPSPKNPPLNSRRGGPTKEQQQQEEKEKTIAQLQAGKMISVEATDLETIPLTGIPLVAGATQVPVATPEDLQLAAINALDQRAPEGSFTDEAVLPTGIIAVLHVVQTIVGTDPESGEKLSTVRAACLVMAEAPSAPTAELNAQEAGEHHLANFHKYVTDVVASQSGVRGRRASRVLPTVNDPNDIFCHFVSSGFGQTNHGIVIAAVDDAESSKFATRATLEFVSNQVRSIQNSVKANGGAVDSMVADMQSEITSLTRMLESGKAKDQQTQEKLQAELDHKVQAMGSLRETTERALAQYDQLTQVMEDTHMEMLHLNKEKNDIELKQVQAQASLTQEKQKNFAAAFRAAFLHDKHKEELVVMDKGTKEEISRMKKKAIVLEQTVEAQRQERERLNYRVTAVEKELAQSKSDHGQTTIQLQKTTKDLTDTQDRAEDLATKLNLSKFESTNETHDLRRELASLERKCDHQGFEIEAIKEDNVKLKDEQESRIQEETQAIRDQLVAAREDQRLQALEARSKQQVVRDMEAEKGELTLRIESLEKEIESLKHDAKDQASAHEASRMKLVERMGRLKEQHSIEREGYSALLGEGREMMQELKRIESCIIERPSLIRSGWPGVVTWLKAHGLSQYQSSFQAAGFTEMYQVVHITEEDLMDMKLLRGSRRKVLVAAENARRDLGIPAVLEEKKEQMQQRAGRSGSPDDKDKPSYAKSTTAWSKREEDDGGKKSANLNATATYSSLNNSLRLDLSGVGGNNATNNLAATAGGGDADGDSNPVVRGLLTDLNAWMKDFSTSIRAEGEASTEL